MPPGPIDPDPEEALREEASDWFARMRAPDAENHRPAFETWLAANPRHRATYDRMALRWQQSGLLAHTEVGRGRAGLPEPRGAAWKGRYYAIAACLVAAVAIGLMASLWSGRSTGGMGVRSEVASVSVSSPVGIRRVRLSDGSIVTLDTETSFTVQMSGGERRIVLTRGRARFEVAHDAGRPFIVSAGDAEVVALGTVFDVSLTTGRPHISLMKGSVEVRQVSAAAPAKARTIARLVPGQSIALGRPAPSPQTAPPAETAWASGMLSFDDAPLRDVLASANRYSTRKVTIDDTRLGVLRVTGTFRADRPDELAATLAAAFGLEVDRRGDALVLRRAVQAK